MPNIVREELWLHPGHPGMLVVTTNSTISKAGGLVMGRGAAKKAVERIQGIEKKCAKKVRTAADPYGFLPVRLPRPEEKIAGFEIFQVKRHWKEQADLTLIKIAGVFANPGQFRGEINAEDQDFHNFSAFAGADER